MTTMLLLLLSGVLIGTGVSLIWRDLHNKRRDAFVLSRDPKADPEVGARCRDHGLASCRVRSARPARTRRGAGAAAHAEQPAAQDRQGQRVRC